MSQLLHHYGYAAVFVLVGLESLGLPLPGESILIAAGVYAGTTHRLSIWGIFALAAAGAILGDNAGYLIGSRGGYRLLRRYGHYIRVHEERIKVGRYIFDRHGAKVVFFGRFVSVLRTYAAFLAGTAKMEWRRFLAWNASGGVVWAAVFSFVPYQVGRAVQRASRPVAYALVGAAVLVVAGAIMAVRRRSEGLTEAAVRAYPGPLPDK